MVTGVTEGKGGLASHLSLRKRTPAAELRQDGQDLERRRERRAVCGCASRLRLMLLALASERHYANGIKSSSLPSLSFVSPAQTRGAREDPAFQAATPAVNLQTH